MFDLMSVPPKVTSVNVVEIWVWFAVATDQAATGTGLDELA